MSELKGNTDASIAFLKWWRPEGPWVLTSVKEGGFTDTRTFSPEHETGCRAWINEKQGKENCYFMVNPATRVLTSKAKKTDVAELVALHVDIDPRAGEDIQYERERALKALRGFTPPPSAIVDSGGGFQGFWRLKPEPRLHIGGDESKAAELEAYNQQLELLFGGDHCHNIDRIMRLPGTINVPDARKRKKGRVPALASVVEQHDDRTYSLSQFTAAPKVQSDARGDVVKISGNLPRLETLDDLPKTVNDYTKQLILLGDDPDDPTKYPSRSEVVFRVCIDLVRAGCEDDVIAAVLLDKGWKISESIHEKRRPEQYAARQIQRAKEEAVDPWLRKLNDKHAVIEDIGGKCRVISEVFDHAMGRPKISRQSFDDFRNRYCHEKVVVGSNKDGTPVEMPVGKWWLSNRNRRQYETIVFAPNKEIANAYNLWKGYGCEAIPGDCSLFLEHIHDNICSGNEVYYEYLLNWMARGVQAPDTPGEVAIVLRGRQGTGKSLFAKVYGSLFGRHFLQVSDPKHLVGSFNAHLRDCVVLFGDEAFYAGDKKHAAVLKALVTEELITIEAKGVDAEAAPNYSHIILASNSTWVVPADADDRRFLVLDVNEERMQDTVYFSAIVKQLDAGGREALLHFLMTRDIEGFKVQNFPRTAALQDQKIHSYSPEEQWWFDKLQEGRVLTFQSYWESEVMKHELQDDYYAYMQRVGVQRRAGKTVLGKFLQKVCPSSYPRTTQRVADVNFTGSMGEPLTMKRRVYFYELPTLKVLREVWDERFGGPFDWQPEMSDPPELPGTEARPPDEESPY